ncbi:MAG: hypothetical protein DDT19_01581 [Syntrophomonadaceae bacterium]|nr:hypothetical protein [Bacillota bacterium]
MLDDILRWLQEALQFLLDKLTWIINALYTVLTWLLDALVFILKAILYLFIDGLLLAVEGFVSALDFSAVVFQWAAGYSFIPPQAIYVMVAIGFPQFVTMIAAAYGVRLLLNLIPSWATRA